MKLDDDIEPARKNGFWGYLPAELRPVDASEAARAISEAAHSILSLSRPHQPTSDAKAKKKKKKKPSKGLEAPVPKQPQKKEKLRLKLNATSTSRPTSEVPHTAARSEGTRKKASQATSQPPPSSQATAKKTKRSSLPIVTTAKKPRQGEIKKTPTLKHTPTSAPKPARVSFEPLFGTPVATPQPKTAYNNNNKSPLRPKRDLQPDASILKQCKQKLDALNRLFDKDVVCSSRLSLRHRAEQNYLRRRVLDATVSMIVSIRDAPYSASLDKAKTFFDSVLRGYEQQAMLVTNRQSMEMGAAGAAMDVTFDDPVLDVVRSMMEFQ